MCGRYVRRSDKQTIAEQFHANPNPSDLPMPAADYNVAPTTHQPIIRQNRETGERELILARWGLSVLYKGFEADQGTVDHQRSRGDNCDISHLARANEKEALPYPRKRIL